MPRQVMALVLALVAGLLAAGTLWGVFALFPEAGTGTMLVIALATSLLVRLGLRHVFSRRFGDRDT